VYDKELVLVRPKITAHQNSVFSLAFNIKGAYLFSGVRDAMLIVWDIN
jgi:WD40 repeat protein